MNAEQNLPDAIFEKQIIGPLFEVRIRSYSISSSSPLREFTVLSKAPDGTVIASYWLRAELDREGCRRIEPVLRHTGIAQDNSILRELYLITQSCSCADWKLEPVHTKEHARGLTFGDFLPAVPSFEDFIEDPSRPSRVFVRDQSKSSDPYQVEAEIAAWGEFLSLKLTDSRSSATNITQRFKVLLPERKDRTFVEAYKELCRLLTKIGSILETAGANGIITALSRTKLEVLRTLPSELDVSTIFVERDFRTRHATFHAACDLAATTARISVSQKDSSTLSKLNVVFSPGEGFREFTAAQVREIRKLAETFSADSEDTRKEAVDRLGALVKHSEPLQSDDAMKQRKPEPRGENDCPGPVSLRSLSVVRAASTISCHSLISSDTFQQIAREQTCTLESQFGVGKESLEDFLQGFSMLSVRLSNNLAERRPELLSRMFIIAYPNGSGIVRVENSMEGSEVFALRPQRAAQNTSVYDELCRAFSNQESGGLASVLRVLSAHADQASIESASRGGWRVDTQNLPKYGEEASIANLETIGTILGLVKRTDMKGVWGVCQDFGAGSAMLGIGRSGTAGALELRFVNSALTQVTVRCRCDAENSPWRATASCSHSGFSISGRGLEAIVVCLREFFRDQTRASLAGDSEPEALARENLVASLSELSFQRTATLEVAEVR